MKFIRPWAMQIMGALNVLFGLAGICMFVYLMVSNLRNWSGGIFSWQSGVFILLSSISMALTISVIDLGIRLLRGQGNVIRRTRNIFIIEIIYFLVYIALFWVALPLAVDVKTLSVFIVTQAPLMPQIDTGYPVVGVIVMVVLSRTRRAKEVT